MNKDGYTVNIADVIWDLLSQWKAILIVALLTALILTGIKYYKDTNAFNAAASNNIESEEMTGKSADDSINKVLNTLPDDERATVEYLVHQDDWMDSEMEYINNSILMNNNPTNQRTLMLDYYISSKDSPDSIAASLAYSYSAYIHNTKIVDNLRQIIDPNADNKYIAELIYTSEKDDCIVYFDDGDVVLTIKVAIPEDVDGKVVEGMITKELKEYSSELGNNICPHTISLLQSREAKIYNTDAVDNKNSIMMSVNNIKSTFIKNAEATLSDGQRSALYTIRNIKRSESENTNSEKLSTETAMNSPSRPSVSKKYVLFGFVLGVVIYMLLYMLYLIFSRSIKSAEQVKCHTTTRLIGEIYISEECHALKRLLHSNFVSRKRYGEKLNKNKQIDVVVDYIASICEHFQADSITAFRLMDTDLKLREIAEEITTRLKEKGIDTDTSDVSQTISDRKLLTTTNAICLIGDGVKVSDYMNILDGFRDFEIKQLGAVYIGRA